jgi:hypothetical protein
MAASDQEQRQADPDTNFSPSAFITRNGLRLPHRISFDKWVGIGRHLCYREAIDQTSLDYQTLRNYAWVARKFPMSRRRGKLSFAHHAEVTALPEPEQDFWLRKAEELDWTVKQLRLEVRTSLQERSSDDNSQLGAESGHSTVTLKVAIPVDHLEACRTAASRQGLNVDEWAGQVLMRVALRESASA